MRVADAELVQHRMGRRQQPLLGLVVPALGHGGGLPFPGVQQRAPLAGDPQLVHLRGGLDVPAAER